MPTRGRRAQYGFTVPDTRTRFHGNFGGNSDRVDCGIILRPPSARAVCLHAARHAMPPQTQFPALRGVNTPKFTELHIIPFTRR